MDDKTVKKICKPSTKDCCRYLAMGSKGWECLKLDPMHKAYMDKRVKENTMRAIGDNCEGIKEGG